MGWVLIVWAFLIGWGPFKHGGDFSQRDLVQIGLAVVIGLAGVYLHLREDKDED